LSTLAQQVAAASKNSLKKTCKDKWELWNLCKIKTLLKLLFTMLFNTMLFAFSHGLVGHMTPDNEDSFKKPLAIAYFNVDYTLNPKGMCCFIKFICKLIFLFLAMPPKQYEILYVSILLSESFRLIGIQLF
jgi:hypothetical protein